MRLFLNQQLSIRSVPSLCRTTGIRTSTAFLKLKHPELAPILSQVLQQTPFSGEHGVQYNCEMSVALFQKVPKEREKQDPYMGTYKEGMLLYEHFPRLIVAELAVILPLTDCTSIHQRLSGRIHT